jgi:hypothetical protein
MAADLGSPMPVAGVRAAPILHPQQMWQALEMAMILLFQKPSLLCRCPAGLDAAWARTIPLAVNDPRIRVELLAAMRASTTYLFFEFWISSRARCSRANSPPSNRGATHRRAPLGCPKVA